MKSALRDVRKGKGLRQQDLAAQADLSQSTVSELERSKYAPSLLVARRLEQVLETPLDVLWPPESTAASDEQRGAGGGTGRTAG
jgi:putative transcriptional regulator